MKPEYLKEQIQAAKDMIKDLNSDTDINSYVGMKVALSELRLWIPAEVVLKATIEKLTVMESLEKHQ
jgi:hypothetical protein